MKKILLLAFLIIAVSTMAFAQACKGMDRMQLEHTVTSASQAEEIVNKAISSLKDYSITKTEEFQVRRGTAYKVGVKDGSGNEFFYFVGPYGMTRGPLIEEDFINNCGCCKKCMGINKDNPVKDTAQAEKILKAGNGLSGVKVIASEELQRKHGIAYKFYVEHNGNNEYYIVNPYGKIRGPFNN